MIIFKVIDGILHPALIHNHTVGIVSIPDIFVHSIYDQNQSNIADNMPTSYLCKFSSSCCCCILNNWQKMNISSNGNFARGCVSEIFKCLGEVEAVKPGETYRATSSK